MKNSQRIVSSNDFIIILQVDDMMKFCMKFKKQNPWDRIKSRWHVNSIEDWADECKNVRLTVSGYDKLIKKSTETERNLLFSILL